MAVDLRTIVDPATTAVLTMELQRGVTGDLAAMQDLAKEVAAAGVIDNVARLCRAARTAGAKVVHCTAVHRPDHLGSKVNSRIQAAAIKLNQGRLDLGQPGVEIMPEIGPEPSDVEVPRFHGMTPFTSTSLDQILRNMGITTVIGTGNSVNIGVIGMVMSAVDLGYQVVVPRDAVAGVPQDYAEAVLQHTVAMLATVVTTDDVIAAWG
ncbi:MAG TPA: cysteine hydrolase [Acidimicrobiales bacterium]|jgi:nicotinamidase-related amidase|nr:cysteine hydrolase [Acidimicrobiales bacterium]